MDKQPPNNSDVMHRVTATELSRIKSSIGVDDLEELKKRRRGSSHPKGPFHKRMESYQALSDIPLTFQKHIKEDKEKQIAQGKPMAKTIRRRPTKNPHQLVQKIVELGRNGLIDEYYDIKASEPRMNFKTAKLPENFGKNRYADVLCLEDSRVILKCEPGESDYINANYVDGFLHNKAYISTQGPLEHTIADFWRMVIQENVRVIVMTTKLAERDKIKCDAYWPLEPMKVAQYGKVKVTNQGIANKGDYQITLLQVMNRETKEVRHLKHFLFLSWPDYGVPPNPSVFLKLLFHVRKAQHESTKEIGWKGHARGPPMIVHCSAGIGRTGTFIAIDVAIYLVDATGDTDLEKVVRLIRKQRAFSIQMPDQYLFCHDTLAMYTKKMGMIKTDVDIHSILFEEAD